MKLFFRKFGEGPAIIIVHGLYGASDNWVSIARQLSSDYEVFLIDQRNHGRSPHSSTHTYADMKEDLREFMDDQGIEKAVLIGHSMGGKTVMFFSKDYPERVNALIVVDIAPKSYAVARDEERVTINHPFLIESMLHLDLGGMTRRDEIEAKLSKSISSERVRKFLLKNLHRNKNNTFSWSVNWQALSNNLDEILRGMNEKEFERGRGITGFPVLFIKGAKSSYISFEDFDQIILKIYPFAELLSIPDSGHWVHTEQPSLLIKNIRYFLDE